MLTAIPRSIFSWSFTVYDGGTPLADLDMSWFRERGSFVLAGHPFDVLRTSILGGEFELRSDESVLAIAKKTSPFLRAFNLRADGRAFSLRADHPFTRCFGLYEGDRRVGIIEPLHFLTRKTRIDLPTGINPPVQVFMFWLVVVLWRRAASSSSGGS